MGANVAFDANRGWLARMDWLPVGELPWHFEQYLPFPPVLVPVPAREWIGEWTPPYPIVLFDANKRMTITDVYGMSAPDQWGRILVAAEDELFRARFPGTASPRIATRLVDMDQVWLLDMQDDQSVYWSDETPEWPAMASPDHFNFDHRAVVLDGPPTQPRERVLTRALDQLGVLTGRRAWHARVEPNAWEACVVVSEVFPDTPEPEELEAMRKAQPDATFKLYVRAMMPADYWLHRLTGEPMPVFHVHAHRVWM
ncbi:hypothetical protein [Nocardia wallacei]|uniref:hypothetical protein n=1 Tax=Nocardia wallacei TaxID=480035 RepID=UPI002457C3EB|nr:hypothetical protein [Nocardia wallacei]